MVAVLWTGGDFDGEYEKFAGHVVPDSGSAFLLALSLFNFMMLRKIHFIDLLALISDGCNKMIGWKTGTQASLEKLLKKALQCIVYFFHRLEKSFQNVFVLYDGQTARPRQLDRTHRYQNQVRCPQTPCG